jgi:hypothetical protein
VLGRVFENKREEVMSFIGCGEGVGTCFREGKCAFRVLVGSVISDEKRPSGRTKHKLT